MLQAAARPELRRQATADHREQALTKAPRHKDSASGALRLCGLNPVSGIGEIQLRLHHRAVRLLRSQCAPVARKRLHPQDADTATNPT